MLLNTFETFEWVFGKRTYITNLKFREMSIKNINIIDKRCLEHIGQHRSLFRG